MIEAVPTTSPASVREVWTGCLRNRSTAIPTTSRLNIVSVPGGAHPESLRQGHGARKNDGVVCAEPGKNLDVGEPHQANGHVAPTGAPVREEVNEAAIAVPQEARA